MFKFPEKSLWSSYHSGSIEVVQLAADGAKAQCHKEETLRAGNINLKKRVHVEGLSNILLSVRHVCDTGNIVLFPEHEAIVVNQNLVIVEKRLISQTAKRDLVSGLYHILSTYSLQSLATKSSSKDLQLWNRLLINGNAQVINQLCHTSGNVSKPRGTLPPCHSRPIGKASRKPL